MKHLKISVFVLLIMLISCTHEQSPVYKNKKAGIEERVTDLIGRMTIDEKVLQLNQYIAGRNLNKNNIGETINKIPAEIGSLIFLGTDPVMRNQIQKKSIEESRLGIPVLFGFDVIHGFRTVYPIPLAQSCSWNPSLVSNAGAVAAMESSCAGVNWTFAPMIDVSRDPRWGRIAECYGEDPYTNAVFGVATVKGFQGENLSDSCSIAACLKHYVGYGMSEGGRDYSSSNISRQSLWETYMIPYEACVNAGASTVMSAFNDISGVPATANHYTLTDVLKNKWAFDGFVVSDWDAIKQLIYQGVAKDRKEAGYKAFMAGVDMDMKDNIYQENLKQLVAEKKISMKKIDESVSRILRIKFRLGLFDNPYTKVVDEKERVLLPQNIAVAEKLAEESMVLLKNKNEILPIKSGIKKIAVIGPMAKNKKNLLGSWSAHGQEQDVESIFEGLEKEFKNKAELKYALGCNFEGTDESYFKKAVSVAKNADIIFACLGEKKEWGGENASRSTIALPSIQEKLIQELKKTGKPIVLILSNGRPLELIRIEPLVDAIVEIWQPGIAGGTPLAGILSGRINPSGKLSVTFPLTTGQIPIYYDMRSSARPFGSMGNYQDISTEPLYWFGHGLSYTTFDYGHVKLSSLKINKSDTLIASITVTNKGKISGKETVFWYISDPSCSISQPVKELKYFEKQEILSGESQTYSFKINPLKDLSYSDESGNRILETGDYFILVNGQKVKFELTEN